MLHPVKVKHIARETADAVCVTLAIPDTAKDQFRFKQGQNLTFIRAFEGKEVRRSYSICSSINEPDLKVGIKRIEGGLFSTWANEQLKDGDTLQVLPPSGHFYVELDSTQQRHHVGIAAGSGITPILSILKSTLEVEPNSTFTLIYGNRSTQSIMFLEELEALKNRYLGRLQIFHVLSRETTGSDLLNGRITGEKVKQFTEYLIPAAEIDSVFLCGPYSMVQSAQEALLEAGVPKAAIHTELFGTPEDMAAIAQQAKKPELSEAEREQMSRITIIVDDKGTEIDLKRGGDSILDAALKVRNELPFACKGGVCATCKAKVLEGKVEMDVNYSLTDEEIAQGYILTCQAHPVSERVIVSFDVK